MGQGGRGVLEWGGCQSGAGGPGGVRVGGWGLI